MKSNLTVARLVLTGRGWLAHTFTVVSRARPHPPQAKGEESGKIPAYESCKLPGILAKMMGHTKSRNGEMRNGNEETRKRRNDYEYMYM